MESGNVLIYPFSSRCIILLNNSVLGTCPIAMKTPSHLKILVFLEITFSMELESIFKSGHIIF